MEDEFNIKLMNRILELRYRKQPKLKEIKKNLFSRLIKYHKIVDQRSRKKDNDSLTEIDKKRWDRQIRHPLINQKKVNEARVVVIGCGGIGTNVLDSLAYSGVKYFIVVDFDIVEISNLNRQILYNFEDIGRYKIEVVKERLLRINPDIVVKTYDINIDYPQDLNLFTLKENQYDESISVLDNLIKWGDFIVNAVDYRGAPYLINDLCVKNKKSFYWAGINHFFGEIYSYYPKKNVACLRCIFGHTDCFNSTQFLRYKTKEIDPTKGVNVGTTVITTGGLISEMIIHEICGIKRIVRGCYFIYDAENFEIFKIKVSVDSECECQKI